MKLSLPVRFCLRPERAGRRPALLLGVVCAVVGFQSPILAAPPAAAPPNRIELLNGRDLAGWTLFFAEPPADPRAVWSFADGVLRLTGKPNGYLRTEKSYANYRLHVEWRWPAGAAENSNSGVFVHAHGPDAIWPNGIECQLRAGNAGQLVGMNVDLPGAPLVNNRKRAPRLAEPSEKPLGEWNTYDIICRGDTIEVVVNGVRQNRVKDVPVTAGAIALQMEGFPIEFRRVWLERL